MKHYLRLRVSLLFLSLVVVLSGCSLLAPKREQVVLRVAYRKQQGDLQPLLDRYMKANPFITIESIEGSAGSGEVNNALAAKELDILLDDRDALQYAVAGQLLPLEDMLVGQEWKGVRDDFFPGTWEGLQIEGRQWGIPSSIDTFVMYINMDALNALGLEEPSVNWTLDDFLMLANAMHKPEGTPENPGQRLWGFCTDSTNYDPVLFVYLMGGTLIDDINKPTRPTLDAPATIEGVKWYTDLFTVYDIVPTESVLRALFSGGINEAARRGFCSTWMGLYSEKGGPSTFKWDFEWKMLPLPAGRQNLRFGDERGFFISRDTAHPEEALKLVLYLTEQWQSAGNNLPARKSVAASQAYAEEVGADVVAAGISEIDSLIILPAQAGPIFNELGEVFLTAVQRVLRGEDPEEVLYQGQQQLLPLFIE